MWDMGTFFNKLGVAGKVGFVLVMCALFAALLAVVPYLLIWSLNTLFGLSIQFTFWTCLAGVVLIMLFGRGGMGSSGAKSSARARKRSK
ncbi:Uncharacterised protein [uncultured archaeon]|nr:Uncharacterised protein [uncultured archaeon]